MIECVVVVSRLMQTYEAPAIELAGERLVLGLNEVFRNHFINEELLVVDLPCPAMRHPGDDLSVRCRCGRRTEYELVSKTVCERQC